MAEAIKTDRFDLPDHLVGEILKQVTSDSVVARLSAKKPMKFGNQHLISFTQAPRAEFVGEGDNKSASGAEFKNFKAVPRKSQVTIRVTDEVDLADEDYQLQILGTLVDAGANALARALDLGMFYRLNPLTGTETDWPNYLNATTSRVTATASPSEDIEKAAQLVLTKNDEGYDVNGLAFSKQFANNLANEKDKQGRRLYPELGLGVNATSFNGINTAVSSTVNPPEAAVKPGVNAIAGDFVNGAYWGIQRSLPVTVLRSGDPDGLGDLARMNHLALRMEVVYAWYVDVDRFAVVENAKPGK